MTTARAREWQEAAVDVPVVPAVASLTLVVPVYNELERFGESREALVDFVQGFGAGSALVVVDDGSDDGTAERVTRELAGAPIDAKVLRRGRAGKGAAVRAGLAQAHTPYAAFCDIDLSTPLDDLKRVVDAAVADHGLAIGSRVVDGAAVLRHQNPAREALGRVYNRVLRATVVKGIHDTQCGAKAAPTSVWRRILVCSHEQGFAWDAEAVAIAQRLGIPVREVGVRWSNDRRTQVRLGRDGLALVRAVPRIARNVRTIGR